ncbi:MAG: hypothetical protein D6689_08405 [Deltaproteobacteria bacterium]|nr:MAG: hypothetical protein D6689_08405 [Deltaproteobacteria bacterium]
MTARAPCRARAACAWVACAAAACGVDADRGRHPAPIVGGAADADHPSVVALVARRAACASAERLVCSGTLVGPRAVLTAAHCLNELRAQELEAIVGDDVAAPAAVLAVWDAFVHPDYDPLAEPDASYDAALVVLEAAPDVPVAPLPSGPIAELAAGTPVRVVGFGRLAPESPPGQRLTGEAIITAAGPVAVYTGDTGVPCGGDSGGAVFADTAEGERLVGVMKASGPDCADFGVFVRVDAMVGDFVAPRLADADRVASSGRPPFDPDASYCAAACTADADCPVGMLCLPERDGRHCGYRDGRVADYGSACGPDGGPECVPVGAGSERSCRQRVPCGAGGGGFCAAVPGGGAGCAWGPAAAVALLAAAHRRRARRRRCDR